jgi:hypothetical protein
MVRPDESQEKDIKARDREEKDMKRQGYTDKHSKEVAQKRVPINSKKK